MWKRCGRKIQSHQTTREERMLVCYHTAYNDSGGDAQAQITRVGRPRMRRRQSPCRGVPQPASSVPPYDPHNDDGGMHVLLFATSCRKSRSQNGNLLRHCTGPCALAIALTRTPSNSRSGQDPTGSTRIQSTSFVGRIAGMSQRPNEHAKWDKL